MAAVLAVRGPAGAQGQSLTVKLVGFHASGWSHTQAVVTVLDGAGEPVSGLTKANFAGQVNGVDVPAVGLSTGIDNTLPLVVVLALDTSTTMGGEGLTQAKLAAGQFLDSLGLQDSVAVLTFGDAPTLVQPFTRDRAAAHAAIDGLTAAGGSALYEATTRSVLLASAQADSGRRAIVLLSDHADTTQNSSQQALFAAKALGVPVFAIGLGSGLDRAFLSELADVSAGQLTAAATPIDLVQQYQNVGKLLRDQYVLTFDASSVRLDTSQAATLRVEVSDAGRTGRDERLVCVQRVCAALGGIAVDEKITKTRSVTAQVVSSETVTSVALFVDGKSVSRVSQPPYVFTIRPADFATGNHTLVAEVETATGSTRSPGVAVRIAAASGGLSPTIFAVAVAAFGAAVMLSLLFIIWRRRRRVPEGPEPDPQPPSPLEESQGPEGLRLVPYAEQRATPRKEPDVVLGRLTVAEGPIAGQGFSVGPAPESIGSSSRCRIRFPEPDGDADVGAEYARVWIREDRLVLHELRRLTSHGVVGGRWELLTTGDVFTIGTCLFVVEIATASAAAPLLPETDLAPDTPQANAS